MGTVSMIPPSVEIASESEGHAHGRESGVLIASWRGDVDLQQIQALVAYRSEMVKASFVGAIHMAEEHLRLPPADVRAVARAAVESRGDVRPAIALVIFGSGFAASAIRSVGTAIFTIRAGPPTRIFSDVKSAALWLSERVAPVSLDTGRLVAACEIIRRAGRTPSMRSGPSP